MPTFAILMGLPGSGKSTAAGKLKVERQFFVVSSDAMRLALNAGIYPKDADDRPGRLPGCLGLPEEGSVRETSAPSGVEDRSPQGRDWLSLARRVRRNEGPSARVLAEVFDG